MALLNQRKWEVIRRPYLEQTIGGEKIKIFPNEFTEFGVPNPFVIGSSSPLKLNLLPLKSPAKSVQDWTLIGEKDETTGKINYEYNWTLQGNQNIIVLNKPYLQKKIRIFKTKEVDGNNKKDTLLSESKYYVTTTATQTTIGYKKAEDETVPNPVMIEVFPDEPVLQAYISELITTSYEQALAKYYELVKEIGQEVVEIKEIVPIDFVAIPTH